MREQSRPVCHWTVLYYTDVPELLLTSLELRTTGRSLPSTSNRLESVLTGCDFRTGKYKFHTYITVMFFKIVTPMLGGVIAIQKDANPITM